MTEPIDILDFNYPLPDEKIAKYPLANREDSQLLSFKNGEITDHNFTDILSVTPPGALFVFNRTRVVSARLLLQKPSGARIEVLCLEPAEPADYQSAFSAQKKSSWHAMIGNAKKFNTTIYSQDKSLSATRKEGDIVEFEWQSDETFTEILGRLGNVPIPPYLNRQSETIDKLRYQTTYAQYEGSVAAPTAGLHFSEQTLEKIPQKAYVTLHVGAGTFLPVKEQDATKHTMHTENFSVTLGDVKSLSENEGNIIAVGTTSLRTIESLAILGGRILNGGTPKEPIGQWERYEKHSITALYDYMREHSIEVLTGSTQIMITPGYKFSTIRGIITNFHQPKSTLLLLISAIVGERWKDIYAHALQNNYRFLSYGDSSYLELPR